MLLLFMDIIKLIYVNAPYINNNKGNSVNIVLKDDQKEFLFSNIIKIVNNGSVKHGGKSSEKFATEKKRAG